MDALAEAAQDRHPAVRDIAQWFTYAHLTGHAQLASQGCAELATAVLLTTPDSPELTAGLRKLLEAKDCFVRAAIAGEF